MEFGMVGLEGLASSSCGFASLSSIDHGKQKCCVSAGFLKQDTPVIVNHDDDGSRASKIAKVRDDLSASKVSSFIFSDDGQEERNLLSFSSPKMEDFSLKCSADLDSKNLQKPAFPGYFQRPSSAHSKISGYSCTGGVNASMYSVNGVKGPFTPAQWIELEHQALIYKYIVANEPIPTTLLIPIRRALESAGFFSFPGGLFRPHSFEWGPFHLGFSNSTDPEPGRCRRTDGKKWRCSREAMPDQKYCERHMNRGRHRSRKPVEGQSGHSFSGSTPTTKLTNSSPLMNAVASSTSATLVVPGVGASDTFSSDHPKSSLVNRLLVDKQNSSQGMQDAIGLNFLSPTIGLHSSSDTLSIAKVHIPFAESNPSGFTVLTSEPLFRPYTPSRDLNTPEPDSQFSARPYADDFLSSTSSPTGQRVTVSPLRLSGDLGMGLGVGSEWSKKQSNWVPISWETSMGGPLGEALKTTSNCPQSRTNNVSSSLNLLLRGGEGSPQLAALSPTGVLQRTPLGSLSSSSAGSSPRAEYGRAAESTGLGVHTVGSALGSERALGDHQNTIACEELVSVKKY